MKMESIIHKIPAADRAQRTVVSMPAEEFLRAGCDSEKNGDFQATTARSERCGNVPITFEEELGSGTLAELQVNPEYPARLGEMFDFPAIQTVESFLRVIDSTPPRRC